MASGLLDSKTTAPKSPWSDKGLDFKIYSPSNLPPMLKNDPGVLMGVGWGYLRRGGSLLISGETGVGKSIFAMQMAIHLVLGKDFFGIPVRRRCRVLMMTSQHEDSAEVLWSHLQGLIKVLEIKKDEREALNRDLVLAPVPRGFDSIDRTHEAMRRCKADVVILNPLQSFCTGHPSDMAAGTALVERLSALQHKSDIALIAIHHVTKSAGTSRKSGKKDRWGSDHYAGIGLGSLFDHFRSGAVLESVGAVPGRAVLRLTKGADRSGWPKGQKRQLYIEWSNLESESEEEVGFVLSKEAPSEDEASSTPIDQCLEDIRRVLAKAPGPLTAAEVVRRLPKDRYARSSVFARLKKWAIVGEVTRSPRGSYSLPEADE